MSKMDRCFEIARRLASGQTTESDGALAILALILECEGLASAAMADLLQNAIGAGDRA